MKNALKFSQAIVLGKFAADPAGAVSGAIYYNTVSNALKVYDGLLWEDIATGSITPEFTTDVFRILDNVDQTKELAFNVAALSTTTTRTISMPDYDVNLADIAAKANLVDVVLRDGTQAMTGALQLGGNNITGVADLFATTYYASGGLSSPDDQGALDISTKVLADEEGETGTITVYSGDADGVTDGSSGGVVLRTGAAAGTGGSGSILLTTGTGGTTRGDISLSGQSISLSAASGIISANGARIASVAAPVAGSDAVPKSYVDAVAEGLKPKAAVRAGSTANLTLSGLQTVDGVSLVAGNRILVKDQTTTSENGIYVVAAGAWARSTDFDATSPIDEITGAYVAVQEGTLNAGKLFVQTGSVVTVGTDPILFVFFNSISGLVAGDGISISGSNVSVSLATNPGLFFSAGDLSVLVDASRPSLQLAAGGISVADAGLTTALYADDSVDGTKVLYADGQYVRMTNQLAAVVAVMGFELLDVDPILSIHNGGDDIAIRSDVMWRGEFNHRQIVKGYTLAGATGSPTTVLTFNAETETRGVEIKYSLRNEATFATRVGTILIAANDDADVSIVDNFAETVDLQVVFSATITAGVVSLKFTNANADDVSMRTSSEYFLA